MSSGTRSDLACPRFPFPDLAVGACVDGAVADVVKAYYASLMEYNAAVASKRVEAAIVDQVVVPDFELSRAATRRAVAHASARYKITGEVSRLQDPLPVPDYGYCYLSMVRQEWVAVAVKVLGFSPTLSKLLETPAQWYRSLLEIEPLRLSYTEGNWLHMALDGSMSAVGALRELAVRAKKWPRGSLGCSLVMSNGAKYDGPILRLLDVVGRQSSKLQLAGDGEDCEREVEPSPPAGSGVAVPVEVSLVDLTQQDGYCYLRAVEGASIAVVRELGPRPNFYDLLAMPRECFKDGRVLRALGAVWFSGTECHVVDQALRTSFADVLISASFSMIGPYPGGSLGDRCRDAPASHRGRSVFPALPESVCGAYPQQQPGWLRRLRAAPALTLFQSLALAAITSLPQASDVRCGAFPFEDRTTVITSFGAVKEIESPEPRYSVDCFVMPEDGLPADGQRDVVTFHRPYESRVWGVHFPMSPILRLRNYGAVDDQSLIIFTEQEMLTFDFEWTGVVTGFAAHVHWFPQLNALGTLQV